MDPTLFNILNTLGITLLLALEQRSSVFREVLSDKRRMRRNAAFLVVNVIVGLLLHRSTALLAPVVPRLDWQGPLWLQIVAAFALGELLNWALHRAKHLNGFLWRLHCQHHKEDHYTVWLTVHTYAPEVLISGTLINCVVLAAGVGPLALDIYLLFYSIANVYQHSALPHSAGWLDRVIVSPAYHRHHHGGAQVNFGSTLTLWDWVFGTVAWPRSRFEAIEPPSITETPEPFGFVDEMLYPFRPARWARPLSAARSDPPR